jgi:single-stranded-DNA-specific exonuclease
MPAQARWLLPKIDPEQAALLAQAVGVRPPAARVLYNRGYRDPDPACRFLNPSLEDLHDPFLLKGMTAAVERLRNAILAGEDILLYGDYDADGTTAVVILKKAIDLAGGRADFHLPHRLKEGYGMRADVIERAAAEGIKLLITLDTGIRAADVVGRARELGIDVIVTDHHLPDAELPPACAIVNPNQPDCAYPDKNLCGAGVAFKLIQGLLQSLGWPAAKRQRLLESLLKLVAIGTVADVVPLTGENRILVKHGLAGLRSVRNPGLRALLDVAGFAEGDVPSAGQVAFRIAPRMNAAGRMAAADDVIELFLTKDPIRARELAGQLHALNQERQQTEAEIVQTVLDDCCRTPVTEAQMALVFSGVGWHRGVIGIVANRLAEKFHRPAFVISEDPATGFARGSGRSIPALHLLEALESIADLFEEFGGHRQAAGLTIANGRIDEFRRRLNEYASARLGPADLAGELEIDALLDFLEISDEAVADIFALAPFGCGNPSPVFAAMDVEVASPPVVWKDKHLRVPLRQHGRTIMCKAWNFIERAGELQAGTRVDAALSFGEDFYLLKRGEPGWNAVLKDVRPA